ncbi:twin-arginine translocation signal domain-containing protein [Marinobacteraceae bacterium S3BR75-40.1]
MKNNRRGFLAKLSLAGSLTALIAPMSLPANADTDVFGALVQVPPSTNYSPTALSGNGRFVASMSRADYLSDNDENGNDNDTFLLDRSTGKYLMVSVDSDGNQLTGGGRARIPVAVDDSGEHVLLGNYFMRLGSAAFLYSSDSGTAQQLPFNVPLDMSEDGSVIAYLASGTGDSLSLFTYTLSTGQKDLIAADISDGSYVPSVDISANGQQVAFTTKAALNGADSNDLENVYVFDRVTMSTQFVSNTPGSKSKLAGMSNDGSLVGFWDDSGIYGFHPETNAVETITGVNGPDSVMMSNSGSLLLIKDWPYLHLKDTTSGESQVISRDPRGVYGVGDDGTVAFVSSKAYAEYDNNDALDLYLMQISLGQ